MSRIGNVLYPLIEVVRYPKHIELMTTLRKERDGKWYKINFWRKVEGNNLKSVEKQALEQMHIEVYAANILYKVPTLVVDWNGNPIVKQDEIQQSEADRMRDLFNPLKNELGD